MKTEVSYNVTLAVFIQNMNLMSEFVEFKLTTFRCAQFSWTHHIDRIRVNKQNDRQIHKPNVGDISTPQTLIRYIRKYVQMATILA